MCGIIGFSGYKNAVTKVIDGLTALEYRGYDSSGVAFFEDGKIRCIKKEGRVEKLCSNIPKNIKAKTACAIGHTRWATHGRPSDENSHPHGTDNVMIVHNGIIENYIEIKSFLLNNGYTFYSETDTEVAAKLLDYYFSKSNDPIDSIFKTISDISGSYAIGAVFLGNEDAIYSFRKNNPIIAALSDEGNFIASDISAVLKYTNKFCTVEEGEIAVVCKESVKFVTQSGEEICKKIQTADMDTSNIQKGEFEHFMLKEIFEQPDALKKTVASLVTDGSIDLAIEELTDEKLKSFDTIHIVACGTALNAGLVARSALQRYLSVPIMCHIASEFRYSHPIINKQDLIIAISQSGETADTLAAMCLAKEKGAYTLAIVNAASSQIAREADSVIQTLAGPEISVASTKAYIVQLVSLYLVLFKIAEVKGNIEKSQIVYFAELLLNEVPKKIAEAISLKDKCEKIALGSIKSKNMFFIGRGTDYAQSREAALKAKEISYIHCEAYAAGELKHGTISLIEEGTPVAAIITEKRLLDKMINNIKEVKSRGAKVIVFITESADICEDIFDEIIYIPKTEEIFMPFVCAPVIQLTAYYMSYHLGHDVDKPRNLAKSVTVE